MAKRFLFPARQEEAVSEPATVVLNWSLGLNNDHTGCHSVLATLMAHRRDTMQNSGTMSPQSTIAHYRIQSKLGEGGMGTVYRATDTKLNRDVAIKVLPDSFAQDADRLARFTR